MLKHNLRDRLYYFGDLDDPWDAWVFYGSEKDCRKFLRGEHVDKAEIDAWMEQAIVFTRDLGRIQ